MLAGGERKTHQRDAVDGNDLKDKKKLLKALTSGVIFIVITVIRLMDDSVKCR